MSETRYGYEIVDHTADLAIRVTAENLPDIFSFSARGLFDSLVGLESIRPLRSERIEIKGRDLEEMLVRMLSQLLYLFSANSLVFCEFIVENLSHERMTLLAKGEVLDHSRHQVKTEIKAATYHDLEIKFTENGYQVTLVFDV